MRLLITGASGQLGQKLLSESIHNTFGTYLHNDNFNSSKNFFKMDIRNKDEVHDVVKCVNPDWIIHLASETDVDLCEDDKRHAWETNVNGVINILEACKLQSSKIIHVSSDNVFDGRKGNYKETDPLLPNNKYAWSKLGGESAVQMYNNSLILRVCMTEKPFVHKKAFYDFTTNFIFHGEIAKFLFKLINKKGIINLGGKTQTVYNFVRKYNPKIKKISAKKIFGSKYPLNPSMNMQKLKKIIK